MRGAVRLCAALAVLLLVLPASAAAQRKYATIDFEGLPHGTPVGGFVSPRTPLTSGSGISGDTLTGAVVSDTQGSSGSYTFVYDASCSTGPGPRGCFPANGNVLLPSWNAFMVVGFAFSHLEGGTVDVLRLQVLGVGSASPNRQASVRAFRRQPGEPSLLVARVPIPTVAPGTVQTIEINAADVTDLQVELGESGVGGIDNIEIATGEPAAPPEQGCRPGFWKRHPNHWLPTGHSVRTPFDATFGVSWRSRLTLHRALGVRGGGYAAFARHAVAALLNAAHPDVNYHLTTDEVLAKVQQAFATGDLKPVKQEFAALNEQGCGLDADEADLRR